MNVIMSIANKVIPDRRASRDFRAKYPDDVLIDQISGEYVLKNVQRLAKVQEFADKLRVLEFFLIWPCHT